MPSSSNLPRDSGVRIRVAPEEVTLLVWPLRQQPVISLATIGIAAGASWLVGWSSGKPLSGVLVAACLALTLWRTWLPVTFEVGLSGITQIVLGRSRRIPWTAIRNFEVRTGGVLLSPDPQMTALSPLRGLYLPWLDQREKVLASVEYYLQIPPAARSTP